MICSFITLVPSQPVFHIDRRAEPGAKADQAQPAKVSGIPSCLGCVGQSADVSHRVLGVGQSDDLPRRVLDVWDKALSTHQ